MVNLEFLQKFPCVFVLFYLETNSKSGKIYLLATVKYRWCAYLSPPFTGINHYNLLKKSSLTLLPCFFMILLAVSMITICSTTFWTDLNSILYIFSILLHQLHDKHNTYKLKDESTSEILRDGFFPLCMISGETFQESLDSEN